MKGVKINNYIDNRIVLSGRKLKNEVQTLIQSNRPRPLVIRHLNYFQEEEEQIQTDQKQTLKAIQNRSAKKLKKRSKASVHQIVNPSNQHSSQKMQKKEKIKKQITKRDKTQSGKKRSSQSSPSGRSQNQFNSTQKKLKSVPKSGQGLGKRSKSAIIKRNKSPTNAHLDLEKKVVEDKNMKIFINQKKEAQSTTKKKKVKKDKDKKPNPSKGKQSKKNLSSLNISDKKKKQEKQTGLKTSRPPSKSYNSSSIHSKPVSARDHKKRDNNLVKNLFGETERQEKKSQHITLQQLLSIQKNDFKIKSAIMKLQDAINSKGSRKKLSEKLQLLAEKLKQIKTESSEEEQQEQYNESISGQKKNNMIQNEQKSIQQFVPSEQKLQNDEQAEKSIKQFKNPEIANRLIKKPGNEANLIQKPDSISKNQQTDFNPVEQQQSKDNLVEREQKRDNYLKDPDVRRGDIQHKNRNFMREQQEQEETNIMIGRKGGADLFADLVDYESINSVKSNQDQKAKQINQLKKFQQQSDMMMKRIKQLEVKKKSEEQKVPLKIEEQIEKPIVSQPNGYVSPRSLQVSNYAFEKYPTTESLKSPKFSTKQINEVIKLKERVLTDRHEKLSQLVNVMFDKKIVSPKTYSLQVQSLRQQQLHNNEVLDNYKKHAEELAQLLSQIKKQKQEISTIDEMIRSQKWDQAMTVIKEGEKDLKIKNAEPQQEKETKRQQKVSSPLQQRLSDQNSEPVYYEGQDSQVSQTGIKLIQIQNDEQVKEQIPKQMKDSTTSLIKIDESSHSSVKKQKGFDSNLFFIKQYCIALCQFVRDNHREDFRFRIGKPMSFDLIKLLKSFRTNKDGSVPYTVNSLYEDLAYHECDYHFNTPPISLEIFNRFNNQYASIKYYGKQQSQDATLEGIFLKSIYDALNESISIQKPGSLNGKALPWFHSSKHLKNLKNSLKNSQQQKFKNQQSEDLIFGIAIARIIQWGSCLCGFIPDTVELQNTEIDQEYVNHIRQTRTALLLEKMLADQQASMYRTELQETEVKLCLAQIIFDDLAKQLGHQMRKIVLRATLRDVDYS